MARIICTTILTNILRVMSGQQMFQVVGRGMEFSGTRPWRDRSLMKILLVDDHALIREALHAVLKKLKRDAVVFDAPVLLLSDHPPTMAVFPSAERATDMPWRAFPTAPVPTSFLPCCVQEPPLRVNTHAASAPQPPTMAVLASAESATDIPWPSGNGGSPAPLPISSSCLPEMRCSRAGSRRKAPDMPWSCASARAGAATNDKVCWSSRKP
jgi:hypothetical protein